MNSNSKYNKITGKDYDHPESIDIPVWVKSGMMLVRRDALRTEDPDHTYNYCIRVLNVRPEEYGVQHPHVQEFGNKTREELIEEILQLRDELVGLSMCG